MSINNEAILLASETADFQNMREQYYAEKPFLSTFIFVAKKITLNNPEENYLAKSLSYYILGVRTDENHIPEFLTYKATHGGITTIPINDFYTKIADICVSRKIKSIKFNKIQRSMKKIRDLVKIRTHVNNEPEAISDSEMVRVLLNLDDRYTNHTSQ